MTRPAVADPAAGEPAGPAPSRRALDRVQALLRSRLLRGGFLLAVAVAAVAAVASDLDGFAAAAGRIGWAGVLLAVAAAALNVLLVAGAWREVLADLGSRLPFGPTARVFLLGQLARYLPGAVWSVVAVAELAHDHGVSRRRTAAASFVALALTLAVGGVLAVPAVLLLPGVDVHPLMLLAVPAALVAFHPAVLNRFVRLASRLARRPAPEQSLSVRGVAAAVAWTVVSWWALSAHVLVLLLAVGAEPSWTTVLVAVSGYPVAWLVGFLVVVAPAGAGAREAALLGVLAAVLDDPAAGLAVALVSRVVTLVADALLALAALALGRLGRRRSPARRE